MSRVYFVIGAPASGKSTATKTIQKQSNCISLNRDTEGGKIIDLLPKMEELLKNNKSIVLDNTFPTVEIRKPFLDLAKKYKIPTSCIWQTTSIEDCQFNVVKRMIDLTGKFLSPEEIKKSKHPNIFPPTVLFRYRKEFQPPTQEEGFDYMVKMPFVREDNPEFTQKALVLDFDSTLRDCVGGNGKYPTEKEHIQIRPNVKKVLDKYKADGYLLLGISNQSGVHKGDLTYEKAVELFKYTNELIGHDIDFSFCPHQSAPISCYCRKPQTGAFVNFMMKYKLSRKDAIFVGDYTSDATMAKRAGIQYVDQAEFFK